MTLRRELGQPVLGCLFDAGGIYLTPDVDPDPPSAIRLARSGKCRFAAGSAVIAVPGDYLRCAERDAAPD